MKIRSSFLIMCMIIVLSYTIFSISKSSKWVLSTTVSELQQPESEWTETTAEICNVTEYEGCYSYTIRYTVPDFTTPIEQHALGNQEEPIDNQKISIRYMKEEPIIFSIIDPIQYKNKK